MVQQHWHDYFVYLFINLSVCYGELFNDVFFFFIVYFDTIESFSFVVD